MLAGAGTSLDFIYVNANTGEAAGGHTALKMGSAVFHFQFFPSGRFLLVRDSWSHFRYVYNELRNRSIFIARLPLSARVYTNLKNHFTLLLIAQQQDLNRLQDAEGHLGLLAQLASGVEMVELETVGLFDRDRGVDVGMRSLQQLILQEPGSLSFAELQEQVNQKLARFGAELRKQPGQSSWTVRLQGLLLEREFLRIMVAGASLTPDAVLSPRADKSGLTPEERLVMERYREKLGASVVGLLQSSRPDRARSLMLQTARYLVVSYSLATGDLFTLDPFSSRAEMVEVDQDDDLQELYTQLRQDATRARDEFFQETVYPDIAYAVMETARGRLHEVEGAVFAGRPMRMEPGILLPVRPERVSVHGLNFTLSGLSAMVEENEAGVGQLRHEMDDLYSYDLTARNCVTELLRALNSAFADSKAGLREMGGWLEPDSNLVFIPSRFYEQVAVYFPVQEKKILLSRRLRHIEELYAGGESLPVWLRESNTLSSTLYVPRTEDTPFLFFTDDVLFLRPVMGIANFCWAAVNGLGGIFTLPVDQGQLFHQGLRGMFYSLPELVFSNIRKGTYGFAITVPALP